MNLSFKPVVEHLNKQTCPVHHKHPEAKLNGDNINIKACCEEFRATLMDQMKVEITKVTKKYLQDAIKKTLR